MMTMTLALPELQSAFADHILGIERRDLAALVAGDSIAAEARLCVYRHHVFHSLTAALAATFPTVQALVGADFFRQLARAFVADNLPTQPVLAEYGADLPAFIATWQPARDLPYLADVARLDWLLNLAYQAPAQPGLDAAQLAAIPANRLPSLSLSLAPGAAVLRSAYPIDRIWRASQPNAAPEETVDLSAGPSCLLALRGADDAGFVSLSLGEAAFLAAIGDAGTLEVAGQAALAAQADVDLTAAFARFLALNVFAAMQQ